MDWTITLEKPTVDMIVLSILTIAFFLSWLNTLYNRNKLEDIIKKKNDEIVYLEVTLDKHRKRCYKNTNYDKCKSCEDKDCGFNLYTQKENCEFMKKMTEEHVKSAIESIHGK